MKQKQTWQFVSTGVLAVALATSVWACSTINQSSSVATTQEQAVVATAPATTIAEAAVPESVATAAQPVDSVTSSTSQLFTLDQSQSQASFTLDEELLGKPTTVVGTTSLVSGEITINPADLSKTTIGTIQIDASDLATDSDRRDGAIQRFILQASNEAYRYITFTPTAIEGLPSTASSGDTVDLQITGDLTISGVTKPVTFAATITGVSAGQISGLATAQVLRSDYNLTIPSVPSVANVSDAVQLQLQFVANAS